MTTLPNKQFQLMMNLSLLSSLNQKTISRVPQYHSIPLQQPQTQPVYQLIHQPLTQMSYHSMVSPKTTLLSYEYNQAPTNDSSFNTVGGGYMNSLFCHQSNNQKSYTAMSYNQHQHLNYYVNVDKYQTPLHNAFIGNKTVRNTILYEEKEIAYNDVYQKVYEDFKDQTKMIEEERKEIEEKGHKHNSAPIKMLTPFKLNEKSQLRCYKDGDKQPVFETYLLKCKTTEQKDKQYKCEHPTCELSYKTKKQKVSHHGKMDPECQKDAVRILRLLSFEREMIRKLIKDKKIKNEKVIENINKKITFMKKNISISDYAQMICKGNIPLQEEDEEDNLYL